MNINANIRVNDENTSSKDNVHDDSVFQEDQPKSLPEIVAMQDELREKVWHERHLVRKEKVEKRREKVDPEIWKQALAAAQRVKDEYGEKNLGPYTDFEWGMLNGKLSALCWVLGDEWDNLDT